MNLNRLFNILTRTVVAAVAAAVLETATKVMRRNGGTTPAARQQARDARTLTKRARQAARITRKFGR